MCMTSQRNSILPSNFSDKHPRMGVCLPRTFHSWNFAGISHLWRACLVVFLWLISGVAQAQIEVPVAYDLGVGKGEAIEGFVIGGSICEDTGLSLYCNQASTATVISYIDVDRIASITLQGNNQLSMNILLKDGKSFPATAQVSEDQPFLILRDEVASGGKNMSGKERTFKVANFRGIPFIEFQAAFSDERSLENLKDLAKQFQEALEKGNLDLAGDVYNKIGEVLDGMQPPSESKTDEKKTGTK